MVLCGVHQKRVLVPSTEVPENAVNASKPSTFQFRPTQQPHVRLSDNIQKPYGFISDELLLFLVEEFP